MPTPRPRPPVAIDPLVWREEVERYDPGSPARVAAERERIGLEAEGLDLRVLLPCDELGPDRTQLEGRVKVYVPIDPTLGASERPYGFVFTVAAGERGSELVLLAYGERHTDRAPTVYMRAHRRIHGRYPRP